MCVYYAPLVNYFRSYIEQKMIESLAFSIETNMKRQKQNK